MIAILLGVIIFLLICVLYAIGMVIGEIQNHTLCMIEKFDEKKHPYKDD